MMIAFGGPYLGLLFMETLIYLKMGRPMAHDKPPVSDPFTAMLEGSDKKPSLNNEILLSICMFIKFIYSHQMSHLHNLPFPVTRFPISSQYKPYMNPI